VRKNSNGPDVFRDNTRRVRDVGDGRSVMTRPPTAAALSGELTAACGHGSGRKSSRSLSARELLVQRGPGWAG